MPKSVYEKRAPAHPGQKPGVPDGWAYIGTTVQTLDGTWKKADVNNRVASSWWLLNADIDRVDYILRDLVYNQATLDVTNEADPDYGKYWLTVTNISSGRVVVLDNNNLPDDMDIYVIKGLLQNQTYEVNLRTFLNSDQVWTNSSIQTFKTPLNPMPLAPTSLYGASTNTYIDLAWSLPAGSTATKYNVYAWQDGQAPALNQAGVQALGTRIGGLQEDTRYSYYVTGVNTNGLEGPKSNTVRWATGHAARRREGGYSREPLYVWEFGSWRNDIGWNDWHYWPTRVNQDSVFQGFWTNDNRRYRGCVTYQLDDFRHRMDAKYGAGVWQSMEITRAEIARVYRMRAPGNLAAQYMLWYLTNVNIFDSGGPPPVYVGHRNDRNDADALAGHDRMSAGTAIDNLRLPRSYGRALISGNWYGTPVNGICLYRGDGENNGYGTAGYGEWCGHGQRDRAYPEAHRYSDWTIYLSAQWSFEYLAYQGPYQW